MIAANGHRLACQVPPPSKMALAGHKTELTYYDCLFSPSERYKNRHFAGYDKMVLGPLHAGENRLTLRSVSRPCCLPAQGFRNDERMLSFNRSQASIESREIGERHTGDGERGTANR
jgi:hypothetical protein